MLAGKRPKNLGIKNGKLKNCTSKPNCVCSHCNENNPHNIKPINVIGTLSETLEKIHQLLLNTSKVKIIKYEGNYLYAECKSKLLGFVDDLEFYSDNDAKVIQVRSASRLGTSDFGVNRKRVEMIRKKLK